MYLGGFSASLDKRKESRKEGFQVQKFREAKHKNKKDNYNINSLLRNSEEEKICSYFFFINYHMYCFDFRNLNAQLHQKGEDAHLLRLHPGGSTGRKRGVMHTFLDYIQGGLQVGRGG